jgi:hypothetical protein
LRIAILIDRLMMARDALDAFEHRELIDDINFSARTSRPRLIISPHSRMKRRF